MQSRVFLAVEAGNPDAAKERAESFLAHHPSDIDWWEVDDVLPLADGDGQFDACALREIEEVLDRKDEAIAAGIRAFAPIDSTGGLVVSHLNPDRSDVDAARAVWTAALENGGRSLSMHREGNGAPQGYLLYLMRKTLTLMSDDFHSEVGFYDTVEQWVNLQWVRHRVAENPGSQWGVIVTLHN